MRFRESERVCTIPGSVSFSTACSITCNPGLAASFPWLSGHAQLFENYKIHKLVFRYKNLKGTNSGGNVILSFDYDTLDSAPTTAVLATQSTQYVDGAPWRIFSLKVPTDGRKLFTRSTTPVGADLKTYDMGKIHISTEGCADTTDHGYIEVDYDIEFFNKQPNLESSISLGSSLVIYAAGATNLTADGILLLDTFSYNGLNATVEGNKIAVPAGTYLWSFNGINTGTAETSLKVYVDDATVAGNEIQIYGGSTNPRTGFGIVVLETAGTISVYCDWVSGTVTYGADTTKLSLTAL
jgi:hypothetical protein